MRKSGEILSLFISLLLFAVADVAALTCSMLVFSFAVCCTVKLLKLLYIVINK